MLIFVVTTKKTDKHHNHNLQIQILLFFLQVAVGPLLHQRLQVIGILLHPWQQVVQDVGAVTVLVHLDMVSCCFCSPWSDFDQKTKDRYVSVKSPIDITSYYYSLGDLHSILNLTLILCWKIFSRASVACLRPFSPLNYHHVNAAHNTLLSYLSPSDILFLLPF